MPLSIKNEPTESLARKLAALTGETLTETIRLSLEERYQRIQERRTGRSLAEELNEIALRCSRRPVVTALPAEEILGYDDHGAPSL
jgi:antitoxin VapB